MRYFEQVDKSVPKRPELARFGRANVGGEIRKNQLYKINLLTFFKFILFWIYRQKPPNPLKSIKFHLFFITFK
jgi:hypothetical protein